MIAFFYMLVGLLGLLDAGISGSFLKLVATNRDVTINYRKVTVLFVKVLLLFIFISGGVILFFIISDNFIATSWLKTSIEKHEAIYSIKAIGFILAALYIKSYLSSFLNGMEKQEWVNIWSVFYSSLFYFGTYYAIREIERTLYVFFNVMLTLAILDVLAIFGLTIYAYISHINKLKKIESNKRYQLDEQNGNELKFKNVLRFSLQLSGLSLIWVVATQIDRFVLSAYISLEEYAKYQIAVQVCAVIAIFSSPLTQLLLPRLSALYADNKLNEYAKLYCSVMLIFIIVFAPIMPYFFIFGDDLITLWMSDHVLAESINAYAKWLVSAAYIAATMNFIFILLYTLGQLKKHFYAYAIYSCFTILVSIYIASNYGAVGSAKFVFFHTIIFMLLWGGAQIKSKLPCFIVLCVVVYISVILSSTLFFGFSFYIMDNYDLHGSLKLFIPPIIHLFFYACLVYFFKKRISSFISNLSLVLN
ncbi:hypothetical protein COOFOMLJ_03048 [Aeromonas veronii]